MTERAGKAAPEFQSLEVHLDGLTVDRLALGKGVVGVPLEYSVHSGGAEWLPFGRFSGVLLYLMVLIQISVSTYGSPALAQRLTELLHVGFVVLLSATILQAIIIGWYNLKRNSSGAGRGKVAGDVRWQ